LEQFSTACVGTAVFEGRLPDSNRLTALLPCAFIRARRRIAREPTRGNVLRTAARDLILFEEETISPL
jgi:hypothetical protein